MFVLHFIIKYSQPLFQKMWQKSNVVKTKISALRIFFRRTPSFVYYPSKYLYNRINSNTITVPLFLKPFSGVLSLLKPQTRSSRKGSSITETLLRLIRANQFDWNYEEVFILWKNNNKPPLQLTFHQILERHSFKLNNTTEATYSITFLPSHLQGVCFWRILCKRIIGFYNNNYSLPIYNKRQAFVKHVYLVPKTG